MQRLEIEENDKQQAIRQQVEADIRLKRKRRKMQCNITT
jgi:hypothetical protein